MSHRETVKKVSQIFSGYTSIKSDISRILVPKTCLVLTV